MSRFEGDAPDQDRFSTLHTSLVLLAFGLTVLGYLVAIGRPNWFVLRPVSSASAAMYYSATPPDGAEGESTGQQAITATAKDAA